MLAVGMVSLLVHFEVGSLILSCLCGLQVGTSEPQARIGAQIRTMRGVSGLPGQRLGCTNLERSFPHSQTNVWGLQQQASGRSQDNFVRVYASSQIMAVHQSSAAQRRLRSWLKHGRLAESMTHSEAPKRSPQRSECGEDASRSQKSALGWIRSTSRWTTRKTPWWTPSYLVLGSLTPSSRKHTDEPPYALPLRDDDLVPCADADFHGLFGGGKSETLLDAGMRTLGQFSGGPAEFHRRVLEILDPLVVFRGSAVDSLGGWFGVGGATSSGDAPIWRKKPISRVKRISEFTGAVLSSAAADSDSGSVAELLGGRPGGAPRLACQGVFSFVSGRAESATALGWWSRLAVELKE